MASMTELYTSSRPVASDVPEAATAAVREATEELRDTLSARGIDVSFQDIALLGHTESWDSEGQRWVHVIWRTEDEG